MAEVNLLLQKISTKDACLIKSDEKIALENGKITNNCENAAVDRGMWSSKTEFLLSCIGYAVGLGNVWRFPYLCYRSGGGAFLIPYLLMCFLCGIPLYFVEMSVGQFTSAGCLGIFRMAPLLKGTGYAIVVINFICAAYCAVVIAYPLRFIQKMLTSASPWMSCNNLWNTDQCIELQELNQHNFTSNSTLKLAADEFFHNEILQISSGIEEVGSIVWPLFCCLFIACVVLYFCIFKGIKSVGKVVYFSATFPFIILIVLFIRGITLPGAMKGIVFYIKPKWNSLMDPEVWTNAALQIFFSLGPGWGGIVNMASFNNFRNNIKYDVLLIPIINCSTSIFAGFVVFSVLGHLSHETGIPVESVATNGPGLVFITYPQAIAMLPLPQLWATLFFLMLFFLGLDTVFVQIETIVDCILDEIPRLKKYRFLVPIFVCLSIFLAATIMVTNGGMYILHLLDSYSSTLTLICICILETVMIAWIYGIDNFMNDITFMIGERPQFFWKYFLKYSLPILLTFLLFTNMFFNGIVTYNGVKYPNWAIAIGWITCSLSIICIPLYMLYIVLTGEGSMTQKIRRSLKSTEWKPADRKYQEQYEIFKKSTV